MTRNFGKTRNLHVYLNNCKSQIFRHMNNGQIILFQTQGGETKIEVRLSNKTVWLTDDQMAELFQRNKSTISKYIKNNHNPLTIHSN